MYIFKEKITRVVHNYEPFDDSLILIRGNHQESFLQLIDNEGIVTSVNNDTAYDFVSANENILFTNKTSSATYSYNKNSGSTIKMPYVLHIKGLKSGDNYLCNAEIEGKECVLVVSLDSLKEIRSYPIGLGLGGVDVFIDDVFLSSKKRQGVIALFEFPNRELWKLNIHEFTDQENDKTSIDEIQVFNDSFVVLFGYSLVCISFKGVVNWITKLAFRPITIDLSEKRGTCVSSSNFCTIDLDSGKVLKSTKLEAIEWAGLKLPFVGSNPRTFNNQLWCTIQANGYNFIAALNQLTGDLAWLQNIETPHFISPPKFHKDSLYTLDTGGNLFVYKKS